MTEEQGQQHGGPTIEERHAAERRDALIAIRHNEERWGRRAWSVPWRPPLGLDRDREGSDGERPFRLFGALWPFALVLGGFIAVLWHTL